MSNISISPSQPQPPLPTPSPFSFSVASTRWSSRRPPIHVANLFLRFLALVLSSASALSLAAPKSSLRKQHTSFRDYPELVYCFVVNILVFLYAAYQLFKGICDIVHRGIFISDMVSDYISLIFDQLAGYLLVSASSVAIPVIQQMNNGNSLWKAAMVSVCMSFASFLVIAFTALLSGYRFCKRIIW